MSDIELSQHGKRKILFIIIFSIAAVITIITLITIVFFSGEESGGSG